MVVLVQALFETEATGRPPDEELSSQSSGGVVMGRRMRRLGCRHVEPTGSTSEQSMAKDPEEVGGDDARPTSAAVVRIAADR